MSNGTGGATVMHSPIPSAANAATQVRAKRTDNFTEQAATSRTSQQSDGLVSGA
jgi:hypothetical protein